MSHGPAKPDRLSSVVNASRYVPTATTSSLIVGVRVRPLLKAETLRGNKRDIIRVLDDKIVVVLDPDESKDYLDQVQNRTKEKRYTFDIAFASEASNVDVFDGTVRDLVGGVLQGINTTVFAYGATGSGKTYTMVGTATDAGLMVQCLRKVFQDRDTLFAGEEFEVTCSYLEVYNELVFDLLVRNSGPLELREDPEQGVQVAGLKHLTVATADEILDALDEGNRRRKTESTDANQTSSRSHAVLEIEVKRRPNNMHYKVQQLVGKLTLVDLAGSERAAETNNAGQKLRDGANINRSLLALANCINALGKQQGNGKGSGSYVPYRNSKLTRLLKDGLSGNSRTAMIATVAAAGDQYHHSISTLKYADRAKEIKTHIVQNVGTVESHITDYQRIIDNLQDEVINLKSQLNDRQQVLKAAQGPGAGVPRSREDDMLVTIDGLVNEMNENIEERINLQKALFEIEDANVYNQYELKQLQEFADSGKATARESAEARDSRTALLEVLGENEAARERYKADIATNEQDRKATQIKIDALVNSNQNASFLNLMGTFRLQAVKYQELKFQMAVRDQIIHEQREVIGNLWKIISKSGMPREKVLEVAHGEGIMMDDCFPVTNGEGGASGSDRPPTVGASEHLQKNQASRRGAADNASPSPPPPPAARRGKGLNTTSSLVGNRAKLRYRFWSKYDGGAESDPDAPSTSGGADQQPGGGGGGPRASRPRHRSAHEPHTQHSINNSNNATAPPPATVSPAAAAAVAALANNGRRSVTGFKIQYNAAGHRKRPSSHRATEPENLGLPSGGGVHVGHGGGGGGAFISGSNSHHSNINNNNATTPAPSNVSASRIKSGRRAGQTASARGPNPRHDAAFLADLLPPSHLPQPAAAAGSGGGSHVQPPGSHLPQHSHLPAHRVRPYSSDGAADPSESPSAKAAMAAAERGVSMLPRYSSSWNDSVPPPRVQPSPGPPPPPPPPPAPVAPVQPPLNERLARLKGRLSRRMMDQVPDLDDVEDSGPSAPLVAPDALDNEIRRLIPHRASAIPIVV